MKILWIVCGNSNIYGFVCPIAKISFPRLYLLSLSLSLSFFPPLNITYSPTKHILLFFSASYITHPHTFMKRLLVNTYLTDPLSVSLCLPACLPASLQHSPPYKHIHQRRISLTSEQTCFLVLFPYIAATKKIQILFLVVVDPAAIIKGRFEGVNTLQNT